MRALGSSDRKDVTMFARALRDIVPLMRKSTWSKLSSVASNTSVPSLFSAEFWSDVSPRKRKRCASNASRGSPALPIPARRTIKRCACSLSDVLQQERLRQRTPVSVTLTVVKSIDRVWVASSAEQLSPPSGMYGTMADGPTAMTTVPAIEKKC
jgi:hypothetical protein